MPETYRPWMNRRVGIEMEMNSQTATGTSLTQRMLFDAISPLGLSNRVIQAGYTHNDGSVWEVKTDGSCGYEVTSPAMMFSNDDELPELRSVCNALTRVGPRIDRRCGLHVHIEVRDYTWDDLRRLLALWTRYEPFFFELLPPSRRNNQYCMPLRKSSWTGPESSTWGVVSRGIDCTTEASFNGAMRGGYGRYHTLNLDNFWRGGRIEFRLHSGTIDYTKIRNWTKLLLALVARVKQPQMPRISKVTANERVDGFNAYYVLKVLGLIRSRYVPDVPASNVDLLNWVEARRRLFDGSQRTRGGRRGTAVASPESGETSTNAIEW